MTPIQSILVPIDFSQACTDAVKRAALIASEHGAHITLFHVVIPPDRDRPAHGRRSTPNLDEAVAKARTWLRRCATECGVSGQPMAQAICVGNPVEELARAATRADLLVLGVKKRNALRDSLFGTPVETLLRLSRRPVLVCREAACSRYRKLLVPVQLTAYSDAVVQAAARLAPTAAIHLLHALPGNREPVVRAAEVSRLATMLHHDRVHRRVALRMRSMSTSFRACDFTICTDTGDLALLASTTRTRIGADLIVACKDDASSTVDFLMADAARQLLADCPCDLLLVPKAFVAQGATLLVVPHFARTLDTAANSPRDSGSTEPMLRRAAFSRA